MSTTRSVFTVISLVHALIKIKAQNSKMENPILQSQRNPMPQIKFLVEKTLVGGIQK